ncbi:MAG TPA: hypothetical protein VHO06_04450 [Polyangia bacterium]|nr:hypothetical protein [Polyangia bacterium]
MDPFSGEKQAPGVAAPGAEGQAETDVPVEFQPESGAPGPRDAAPAGDDGSEPGDDL